MMAYYDRIAHERKIRSKEKFEELKRFITSVDENKKMSEFFDAHEHIRDMEITIEKQAEEIKRYREFFLMLRNLTPKHPSTNDIIG